MFNSQEDEFDWDMDAINMAKRKYEKTTLDQKIAKVRKENKKENTVDSKVNDSEEEREQTASEEEGSSLSSVEELHIGLCLKIYCFRHVLFMYSCMASLGTLREFVI